MLSPRRSLLWTFKTGPRRGVCAPTFNAAILGFLLTVCLVLFVARTSPSFSNPSESLGDYRAVLQKVTFLISDHKEDGDYPKKNKPLDDKIFSVFNQTVTTHAWTERGKTANYGPQSPVVSKTANYGPQSPVVSKGQIAESEEDFNLDDEFHPPTNSRKIYANVGSLLQTFVGSKGFKEMQKTGLFGGAGGGDSLISNLFARFKKTKPAYPIPPKFKNSGKDTPKLADRQAKLDAVERQSFQPIPNERSDSSPGNRLKAKSSEDPPRPHAWIADALKDPKRNQSAQQIQKMHAILARRTSNREQSSCNKILPIGKASIHDQFDPGVTQLVCRDDDFEETFKKGCIVYSFGIHGNWDFENSLAKKGCKVLAFDAILREKPKDLSPNIRFSNVGLGPEDEIRMINKEEVQFYTLQTLMKKLKHTKSVISYLKMNLNGDEWPILEQVTNSSPTISNNILQLGLTTHLHTAIIDFTLYGPYALVLKHLESLGYQMFTSKEVEKRRESYLDPLLDNKRVTLTNYLAFMKI